MFVRVGRLQERLGQKLKNRIEGFLIEQFNKYWKGEELGLVGWSPVFSYKKKYGAGNDGKEASSFAFCKFLLRQLGRSQGLEHVEKVQPEKWPHTPPPSLSQKHITLQRLQITQISSIKAASILSWGVLRGCSSYFLEGEICELVPLRVTKLKMTAASHLAVPFRGLKVHRSEKMTKTVTILLHKELLFLNYLRENSHAIGI